MTLSTSMAPARWSYRDVIAVFEEVTGRSLAVQQVPAESLAAQRDASSDEREQSFAGLMLGVAAGSPPGDGEEWLRRLGVERAVTVRDVAARAYAADASAAHRGHVDETQP